MNNPKFFLLIVLLCVSKFYSQSSNEIYLKIQKLNSLASVLYIAAHPDDENTSLISYLSNELQAHTSYLSLTRGDGGQNLIGTELNDLLGVIRTNELLQARLIDGGKQYFTSAIDFGFSKNSKETLEIWPKNEILEEIVRLIREIKPDIIINRFDHRRDGKTHGHHTASAILSKEAFEISDNPNFYPSQLDSLDLWKPSRQYVNISWWRYGSREKFNSINKQNFIEIDITKYNFLTGKTNSEISALSRSQHKSQGFGRSPSLEKETEYLELIGGLENKSNDIFEGINTTWNRLEGGKQIKVLIDQTLEKFDFEKPEKSVKNLLKISNEIKKLRISEWKTRKLKEVKEIIRLCLGIKMITNTDFDYGNNGEEIDLDFKVLNNSSYPIYISKVDNQLKNIFLKSNELYNDKFKFKLPNEFNTPYWLIKNKKIGKFTIDKKYTNKATSTKVKLPVEIKIFETYLDYNVEVSQRINNPIKGEVINPFYIVPKIAINFKKDKYLFLDTEPQKIIIGVKSLSNKFKGEFKLNAPDGWEIEKEYVDLFLTKKGETKNIEFQIRPSDNSKDGVLSVSIISDDKKIPKRGMSIFNIEYDHIPKQYILMPFSPKIKKMNLILPRKKVGYIVGAGDLVYENLKSIGLDIELIDINEIENGYLDRFDTIIMGIRAYNVNDELISKNELLFDYAKKGGNLLIQYNTTRNLLTNKLTPFNLSLSRDRVTEEDANVKILNPLHRALNFPHKITSEDFGSWVQERGLYFPSKWDKNFIPILSMNDKNETEKLGSLLIGNYGKGKIIYTGLSFFRQIPSGVTGAYRLLINLISLE
ncbi:MAG: PIG-L family deacetylase [Flavobacteriaceae bacterium]